MVWNEEHTTQTQRNWFSRFARRLSSSLVSFETERDPEESSSALSSSPEDEPRQLPGPQETFVPPYVWSDSSDIASPTVDHNESRAKDAPSMPFPVLQMPQVRSLTEQSRQRLAGHITKIRLEAPPVLEMPSSIIRQNISETPREILDVSALASFPTTQGQAETPSPIIRQNISETPREILDVSALASFPTTQGKINPQATKGEVAPSHLPTRNGVNKMEVGTQRHLPTGRMFKGNIRIVTRNPLCGSGEFSCGQCDVIIKNPAVRASSVIVVTLTSNPGPVVVQYVSLLPYEGFTVHLTAPTTMHARFNYMILSSELP